MKQYQTLLKNVLENDTVKTDRTGTGTISQFGAMMKFPLRYGLWPIVTTRKVSHKQIAQELEWMIKGLTDVKWLQDHKNHIWDSWTGHDNTIGPMYGEQWRNWGSSHISRKDKLIFRGYVKELFDSKDNTNVSVDDVMSLFNTFIEHKTTPYQEGGRGGVDQLQSIINELLTNPDSRRMVVNVWDASLLPNTNLSPNENVDVGKMALAPCHSKWQVYTAPMSDLEILSKYLLHDVTFCSKVEGFIRNVRHTEVAMKYIDEQTFRTAMDHHLVEYQLDSWDEPNLSAMMKNATLTPKGKDVVEDIRNNGFVDGRQARKLSLSSYCRSQDLPLGTSYNVGMYSLLAHLLADITKMVPWEYTHFMGDAHIYLNQVEQVKELLSRTPKEPARLIIPPLNGIDDFDHSKLQVWYDHHPAIKFAPAAV